MIAPSMAPISKKKSTSTKKTKKPYRKHVSGFVPVAVPVAPSVPVSVPVIVPVPVPVATSPCKVSAALDCKTSKSLPCKDFTAPNTTCVGDAGFVNLEFRFADQKCTPNSNGQGGAAFCSDFATLSEPAQIECLSDDAGIPLMVIPAFIRFGDFFTVKNPNGGKLPNKIDCTVINANDVRVQQVVVDTSGDVPTKLGDQFGSFELVTCADQKCFEIVTYDIRVSNTGSSPLTVTFLDFTFFGETERLLRETPLAAGAAIPLAEARDINVCSSNEFFASVNTTTSGAAGICAASAQYRF
jgi:hypothetical protein